MRIGPFTVWGLRLRQTPPIPNQIWKINFKILNLFFLLPCRAVVAFVCVFLGLLQLATLTCG